MNSGEGDMSALRVIDIPDQRPSMALELPEQTSFDEWVSIGRRLCIGSQALNWHIGDWWAFGDHRYGDRAKVAAEGIFGREFQTLRNLATVSRAIEVSRRRDVLSWTHHAEVAALPAEDADALLTRALRDQLSTRDLRREVHALKAANDVTGDEQPQPATSKSVPRASTHAETVRFAAIAVELGQSLEARAAPLTDREARIYNEARDFLDEDRLHRESKCPTDFDTTFVEKGRVECEVVYGVRRTTVDRWLLERGKTRLLELRANFVRNERRVSERPSAPAVSSGPVDAALYAVAKQAAHFIRVSRYGGWRVSPAPDGEWFVGSVRKTSDELIAIAERQGFDSGSVGRNDRG